MGLEGRLVMVDFGHPRYGEGLGGRRPGRGVGIKRMIGFGLAVAAMTTCSAALAQADFCAEVREVAAAARETPPFASLARHPDSRPMLGFGACFITHGRDEAARFECRHFADDGRVRTWPNPDELMPRIAICLPQAVRSDPETRYLGGRGSRAGQLVPEEELSFPPGDYRNNLRHHRRTTYVDSGPLRFEHRLVIHPRIPSYQELSVYIRDADAETPRPR